MFKIIVYGFPCIYGGANAELFHQILLWKLMRTEIHIIPDMDFYKKMPLYYFLIENDIKVHKKNEWNVINENDIVISFCKKTYLNNLRYIRTKTNNTIYVNCMRDISSLEAACVKEGLISMLLYQTEEVYDKNVPILKSLSSASGSNTRYMLFTPYFHFDFFPFYGRSNDDYFGCGRISRRDKDKYSKDILNIYNYFSSPIQKKGIFIGFSDEIRQKIGDPPDWISTYPNTVSISQCDFYRQCHVILNPSDTVENWPRVGFEAMSSGSVLIVDNRGGWKKMVKHGQTGWLCDSTRDFIQYAQKMANEPNLRLDMTMLAREHCEILVGYQVAKASWEEIFSHFIN